MEQSGDISSSTLITAKSREGRRLGGDGNNIGATASAYYATYALIGTGLNNCIDSSTASSYYSFIGSGQKNTISAGTCYSSILNGDNNTNSGSYSAILGGSGNTIGAGYQYAAVFGCNVVANTNCAFHANNFVAQNMPPVAGYAPGTLMYWDLSTGPLPSTGCVVFIA